jgi:hypothetical protein
MLLALDDAMQQAKRRIPRRRGQANRRKLCVFGRFERWHALSVVVDVSQANVRFLATAMKTRNLDRQSAARSGKEFKCEVHDILQSAIERGDRMCSSSPVRAFASR